MRFCKNCGNKMTSETEYCTNCGQSLQETISKQPAPQRAPRQPMSKKTKVMAISIAAAAILFFGVYKLLDSMYSPVKTAEQFIQAIEKKDAKQIAEMIQHGNAQLKTADAAQASLWLSYLDNNPDLKDGLINSLTESAQTLESGSLENGGTAGFEESQIHLIPKGKKWMIFDEYAVYAQPVYIEVQVNEDDTLVQIDGKNEKTASKEKALTFGPYLPGEHTVSGLRETKFAKVEQSEVLESWNDSEKLYTELDMSGDQVYVSSNYSDAILFVNGKSTGMTIEEAYEFGPITADGSLKLHAERKKNGKTFKSSIQPVKNAEESLDLWFEEEAAEDLFDDYEADPEFASSTSEIEDVIRSHYTSISSGEYEAAFNLFDSSRQAKYTVDNWAKGMKDNISNEILYVSVDEDDGINASASFEMISRDKQEDGSVLVQSWKGSWTLVNEDGAWKLKSPSIDQTGSRTE
ncbi:zinc ribbon domain-containing protein [Metabacillus sp. 113a]|uniref:zinc ribbon domain-containing protein n=1 Tax=Metabacillus sp. 113a TaxID=3404706 RepID=UPI003CF1749A